MSTGLLEPPTSGQNLEESGEEALGLEAHRGHTPWPAASSQSLTGHLPMLQVRTALG